MRKRNGKYQVAIVRAHSRKVVLYRSRNRDKIVRQFFQYVRQEWLIANSSSRAYISTVLEPGDKIVIEHSGHTIADTSDCVKIRYLPCVRETIQELHREHRLDNILGKVF